MQKYTQGDNIPEIVIPLMVAKYDSVTKTLLPPRELIGTGFIIGVNGFALTAAHVIDQLIEAKNERELLVTHLQNLNGLHPFSIIKCEKHPNEDIGIIQLSNPNLKSWLHISQKKYLHSAPYMAWGFPREMQRN